MEGCSDGCGADEKWEQVCGWVGLGLVWAVRWQRGKVRGFLVDIWRKEGTWCETNQQALEMGAEGNRGADCDNQAKMSITVLFQLLQ